MLDGWPRWLLENIPREVLCGLVPRSADSYDKIDKVGQGTYSNVYKAVDRDTGKIVALKKVRFDTSESESVRFMAREIMILQKLDHPNVIKLEGLATSRMHYSPYLVFDFMQTDLARVISRPDQRLTESQVKCYMQQLLSGLRHCHERGIFFFSRKDSLLPLHSRNIELSNRGRQRSLKELKKKLNQGHQFTHARQRSRALTHSCPELTRLFSKILLFLSSQIDHQAATTPVRSNLPLRPSNPLKCSHRRVAESH